MGRLSENDFKSTMNSILDEARNNTAAISVSHKITADQIAAAQAAVDGVTKKSGDKDTSFNDRSALRKNLTADFDNTDDLLINRYDKDMELIRASNVDVYNKYKSARVIKDLGGSHNGGEDTPPQTPPAQ